MKKLLLFLLLATPALAEDNQGIDVPTLTLKKECVYVYDGGLFFFSDGYVETNCKNRVAKTIKIKHQVLKVGRRISYRLKNRTITCKIKNIHLDSTPFTDF